MKTLSALCALTLWAACSYAQPWQWQRYSGDYYHPTNFPQFHAEWPNYSLSHLAGDFDWDGRAEFLDPTSPGTMAALDPDTARYHWTVQSDQTWPWWMINTIVTGFGVAHVTDGAVLVAFTMGAPLTFSAQRDSNGWSWYGTFVAGLEAPAGVLRGAYGDYDGDGLLNGVFVLPDSCVFTHRGGDGVWVTDSTLTSTPFGHGESVVFDGDFDWDGRLELAITSPGIDTWFQGVIYDGNNGTLTRHDLATEFPGPVVGDFNGDGRVEGLFRFDGFPQYAVVSIVPNTATYLRTTFLYDLARPNGPILGNHHCYAGTVPVGIENAWRWVDADAICQFSRVVYRTAFGWRLVDPDFMTPGEVLGGSTGDFNGDGWSDAFLASHWDCLYGRQTQWALYYNYGPLRPDSVAPDGTFLRYFGADTTVSCPRLGDVDGNGRAELAFIQDTLDTHQICFYEFQGVGYNGAFYRRPDLEAPFPDSLSRIALADVDNDGYAELFVKTDVWHCYFRRHNQWLEYDINFPVTDDTTLAFADVDGNGTQDAFAQNDVWLNINPTAARDASPLEPSSFTLSAFPNPFNPATNIHFELPKAGQTTLRLFDLTGREVASLVNGNLPSGSHEITWNASQFASGVYFARLECSGLTLTQKLLLLK
jgi:hypothetical protein